MNRTWSPLFDPSDIEMLFLQDDVGTHGWWPDPVDSRTYYPDAELARLVTATRNAVLLPLSENFLGGMRDVLALWELEMARRLRQRRLTAGTGRKWTTWQDTDLVAAVAAVCGPGLYRAREVWFRCPFHEDRHPSLEVNAAKKVWHCWGCDASGGVVDWRKRMTQETT